jgi:phosphoglycerate kinase
MQGVKFLKDFHFKGKKVLLRVDLNVPIMRGKITDSERIVRIIPTIKYLQKKGARIVLLSHFGRPNGHFDLSMSLAPLVDTLNNFLPKSDIHFAIDCVGAKAAETVNSLKNGEIALLENLRFYQEEENNNQEFAKELSDLGDIYINDTFSCSHRKHASIIGIPQFLPSGMGLLFQEEIENLEKTLTAPKKPIASIIGGSKVSTKLDLIYSLIEKSQFIIIGGGMANTFLKAQKHEIGKSIYEKDLLKEAKKILDKAKEKNCEIILPSDAIISPALENADCEVITINAMPKDQMILDIGPDSCDLINRTLESCETIIWNGPLGAFEYRPFNVGTESVARKVAGLTKEKGLVSVAGGGDIVCALKDSGLKNSFTYLSTAGGAFLEWIKGKELPGIAALRLTKP